MRTRDEITEDLEEQLLEGRIIENDRLLMEVMLDIRDLLQSLDENIKHANEFLG